MNIRYPLYEGVYRILTFLRTHPDIALEYGELKMELAYRFSEDIEGYCTGKDAFVKQLEKDALLWYQNNESYKTR